MEPPKLAEALGLPPPGNLTDRIMDALDSGIWATVDELIELVFGPGPYTLAEAKALNKVHTTALGLARAGRLARIEPSEFSLWDVVVYRKPWDDEVTPPYPPPHLVGECLCWICVERERGRPFDGSL